MSLWAMNQTNNSLKPFLSLPFPSHSSFRYYRFNEEQQSVDSGYPKAVSVWQGVPNNIKSAFMSKDQGEGDVYDITYSTLFFHTYL